MKLIPLLLSLAVLPLMALLVGTRSHDVTYSIAAKGNNYPVMLEDLEACQRIYTEEYMPDEDKRVSLIIQCMVIERGHHLKQTN